MPHTPQRHKPVLRRAGTCRPVRITPRSRREFRERQRNIAQKVVSAPELVADDVWRSLTVPPRLRIMLVFDDMEKGLFAAHQIPMHTFVCEYGGTLCSEKEGILREE